MPAKTVKEMLSAEICIGCGNCVIACPINAARSIYIMGGKGPISSDVLLRIEDGLVNMLNPRLCDGCRVCTEICPTNAMETVMRFRRLTRAAWMRGRKRYSEI